MSKKTITIDVGEWELSDNERFRLINQVSDAIKTFHYENDDQIKIKEIWISGSYTRWVECMKNNLCLAVRCLKAVIDDKVIFIDDAGNNHNCEPLIAAFCKQLSLSGKEENQITSLYFNNKDNLTWSSLFNQIKKLNEKLNLFSDKHLQEQIEWIKAINEGLETQYVDFDKNINKDECYWCHDIPDEIAEIYDDEEDNILYVCKECVVKDDAQTEAAANTTGQSR